MNGTLLALAAVAALWLPRNALDRPLAPRQANVRALFAAPGFLPLMALAALVIGGHALHDGFEVLRWEEGGIGPGAAGLLWSEGVLAEVVVFVVVGPTLLRWLGPAGSAALAASAGIVRWSVTAVTASLPAMALVEPLHGLTFALLHLACVQMLSVVVSPALAATAQAIYGGRCRYDDRHNDMVSSPLFGTLGPRAFWVMGLLCAAALPIAFAMRRISINASRRIRSSLRLGSGAGAYRTAGVGKVEMWRGDVRLSMSVPAPFVWRCLRGSAVAPFPHPAHRTGRADFPHPALGQDFTPSFACDAIGSF